MASDTERGQQQQQLRCSSGHAPHFSARHPMIPRFYVLPWKQDMKNQRLLLQNAVLAQIPVRPLEESLCLCSRERLCHAQKLLRADRPAQSGLGAHLSSRFSRYNSSVVTTRGLYSQSR